MNRYSNAFTYIFVIALSVICAVSLCFTVVSASVYTVNGHEYNDLPINHIDEYPKTPDGYLAFYYDTITVVQTNYYEYKGWSDAWQNWNDVTDYFLGDDNPLHHNLPDPRSSLSDYYLHGGSTNGVPELQYSDGKGGHFYVDHWSDSGGNHVIVYYKPANGPAEMLHQIGEYSREYSGFYVTQLDPYTVEYHVDMTDIYNGQTGDITGTYTFPEETNVLHIEVDVPVGGTAHGIPGHLYRDPDGNLYFVDPDDHLYPFNPDGTIHFPDGDYPFDVDPKTLQPDDKDNIDNNTDWYNLYMLQILRNINNDGNENNCGCPDYSAYLNVIGNRLNVMDAKMSTMIDELRKIEKNTRGVDNNIFDNTVMDLVLPDDQDVQIEFLSDAIMKKINFGQYFTQLNNLLHIAMGSDYVNSTNFDKYFNLDQYIRSSGELKMSTRDAKAIYGKDLSDADIQVTDSDYLSATAMVRGSASEQYRSSVSSQLVVIPALYITIYDQQYNLFDWITPEMYDFIRPFKNLLSLILQICWMFWVVKWLPNLIHNVGQVADYK